MPFPYRLPVALSRITESLALSRQLASAYDVWRQESQQRFLRYCQITKFDSDQRPVDWPLVQTYPNCVTRRLGNVEIEFFRHALAYLPIAADDAVLRPRDRILLAWGYSTIVVISIDRRPVVHRHLGETNHFMYKYMNLKIKRFISYHILYNHNQRIINYFPLLLKINLKWKKFYSFKKLN